MPDVLNTLADRFASALAKALGDDHATANPLIRPSSNPQFGDYQANLAMSLAKQLEQKPRDVAQRIVDQLDTTGLCDRVEVAGPGFINLHLSDVFLSRQLAAMAADMDRCGLARADPTQTVVVDYSGPNVAKEMHVGHLRSTVIGDCLARVLAFQGHTVIRQNHLGDWGTQFGMLILHLEESTEAGGSSLNELYQAAKQKFDQDPDFANRARQQVVELQSGDGKALAQWRRLVDQSKLHFQEVYSRLDVLLTDADYRGESFYNPKLAGVIEGLAQVGLLMDSRGARVVFPEGFKDREANPQAMIVRKGDGGYLYATTDLAAARFRIEQLRADRIIYVTDARQSQHFAMVFAVLRQAGWASDRVRLDHVPFGTVLGGDGKPFKTRAGGIIKLIDLLEEAQKRAGQVVETKDPNMPAKQRAQVAHVVGLGALKYADLANDRIKDYVFDWDRMLSFDGNTAPYLQNAYVRIQSIFRKGEIRAETLRHDQVAVAHPAQRAVAVKLLQLPSVIDSVSQSLEPHRLCTYLYELASAFHQFYEKCPVLGAPDDQARVSRLVLCDLVGRTLKLGLGLLGIGVVDRM